MVWFPNRSDFRLWSINWDQTERSVFGWSTKLTVLAIKGGYTFLIAVSNPYFNIKWSSLVKRTFGLVPVKPNGPNDQNMNVQKPNVRFLDVHCTMQTNNVAKIYQDSPKAKENGRAKAQNKILIREPCHDYKTDFA